MASGKLNQIKAGFLNYEITVKIIDINEFKQQNGEKYVKILLGQRTSRIQALAFPKVGIEFTRKYTVGQSLKFPSGTFVAKKRDKTYTSGSTCNFDLFFHRVPPDTVNQHKNANTIVSNVCVPQAGSSGNSARTNDFNEAAERIKKRGAFSSDLSSILIKSGEVYRYLGCSKCSKRVDKSDKDGKYRCNGKSCKKKGSRKWVETTAKICLTIRDVTISNSNGNSIHGIVIFDKHANKLLEIDDVDDFKDDNEITAKFTKLLNAKIDAKLRRNNVKSGSSYAPPLMLEEINVKELAKVVTPIKADSDSEGEDSDGWFADEGEEIVFGKKKKKRQDKIAKELGTTNNKVGIILPPLKVNVVKDGKEESRKDLDIIYPNDPREGVAGIVLLINNMNYPHKTKEEHRIRHGSEVDVEILTELFKQMEYQIYTNCSITDIQDSKTMEMHINGYKRNLVSSKAHSAIIIFMGHGHNHEIELTGKNSASGCPNYANIYHDIIRPFSNKSFPEFENKPKVFIFESCQNFAISDYSAELKMQNDIPSDILICLPALPGFTAYRSKTKGSLFMHYFVKVMMNHAYNMHMVELMDKIQKRIAEEIRKVRSKTVSISHWQSFLFSKFYLLPRANIDLPKLVGADEGIEDMDET